MAKASYNESPFEIDQPEGGRQSEAIAGAERRAAEFQPLTPEDWAFKIIFAGDDGDMNMSVDQAALAKLAYEFVGITPRVELKLP